LLLLLQLVMMMMMMMTLTHDEDEVAGDERLYHVHCYISAVDQS